MSLPPDLSRLGDSLQQAADREVARRRRAWALRTATLGAVLACVSGGLVPDSLAPGLRAPAGLAENAQSRCTDRQNMRRNPCSDPPAFVTDAAAGRESPTVIAHFGDAAQQSGRPRPESGPGGYANLY
jgi:hypothetical protein